MSYLFTNSKISDQLLIIEEEDKVPVALTEQDLKKKLEEKRIPDGARITKITVLEKGIVASKKEIIKINGDDHAV